MHVPSDETHQDEIRIVVGQAVFSIKFMCHIIGYVCDYKLTRYGVERCKTNLQSLTVTCCGKSSLLILYGHNYAIWRLSGSD